MVSGNDHSIPTWVTLEALRPGKGLAHNSGEKTSFSLKTFKWPLMGNLSAESEYMSNA